MGTKQSRVEMMEPTSELRLDDACIGETQTSIRLTQDLIDQINGSNVPSNTIKQTADDPNPQKQVLMKQQLPTVDAEGADDYCKKKEVDHQQKEQSATSAPSLPEQAQLAKEQEERENQRVRQLVAEIYKKKYRAPLHSVQCSTERESCLQCYRDKKSDVLQCKVVADVFVQCARQNTEKVVGGN